MSNPMPATQDPPRRRWPWIVALLLLAVALPLGYFLRGAGAATPPPAPAAKGPATPEGVSCLGRLEPDGGVIHVAASYLYGRPQVVRTLLVAEGSAIRRGQPIAILTAHAQLQAALRRAEADTLVARKRLDQIKAGPKPTDLDAQRDEIARLEADLQLARTEYQRYSNLRKTGDISAATVDATRTRLAAAELLVTQARHRLDSLGAVPPQDIAVAEAQVQASLAEERRAQRELELASVTSPADGQVVKIHAKAGEEVGPNGILELAKTDRMYAIAEVYESDLNRVRAGMTAVISSDLLASPVTGHVEQIGSRVKPPAVLTGDPLSFSDSRIVEVKVRIDDPGPVARLIDGKVSVVIKP